MRRQCLHRSATGVTGLAGKESLLRLVQPSLLGCEALCLFLDPLTVFSNALRIRINDTLDKNTTNPFGQPFAFKALNSTI